MCYSNSVHGGLETGAKKRRISSKRSRKKSDFCHAPFKADTIEHQDDKEQEQEADNDASKECHEDEEGIAEDFTVEKLPPSINCKTKLHRILYEAFKCWQLDRLDDASKLWKWAASRAMQKKEFKKSNDGILEIETKEDGKNFFFNQSNALDCTPS